MPVFRGSKAKQAALQWDPFYCSPLPPPRAFGAALAVGDTRPRVSPGPVWPLAGEGAEALPARSRSHVQRRKVSGPGEDGALATRDSGLGIQELDREGKTGKGRRQWCPTRVVGMQLACTENRARPGLPYFVEGVPSLLPPHTPGSSHGPPRPVHKAGPGTRRRPRHVRPCTGPEGPPSPSDRHWPRAACARGRVTRASANARPGLFLPPVTLPRARPPVSPNQRAPASRLTGWAALPRKKGGGRANGREAGHGDRWAAVQSEERSGRAGRSARANACRAGGRSPAGGYKEARGGRGQDLFHRMSASQESR